MTRVRTDNVFGTVTDDPLTDSATTLNSAGLANLAAVSSAEAIIILDPNRVNGAPEIVVVTAHTGSATSATITRGQFGTSAREHASGTEWVHGPIASNATSYATAADDQGDYVPMNAWGSYTPAFTNVTVGSGSVSGAYVRIGRTILFRARFTFGAGSAVSGAVAVTLPVAAIAALDESIIGQCEFIDANGTWTAGVLQNDTTTTARLWVLGTGGTYAALTALSSTVPMTWATGDFMDVTGRYEAAS